MHWVSVSEFQCCCYHSHSIDSQFCIYRKSQSPQKPSQPSLQNWMAGMDSVTQPSLVDLPRSISECHNHVWQLSSRTYTIIDRDFYGDILGASEGFPVCKICSSQWHTSPFLRFLCNFVASSHANQILPVFDVIRTLTHTTTPSFLLPDRLANQAIWLWYSNLLFSLKLQ